MAEPLKIALIGCGRQARKHIAGYRACPDVELVLADAQPERARALAEQAGLAVFPSVDAALEDPSVTAIDLCTPTPTHGPLIKRALAGHKDFLTEKPLCGSYSEARDIVTLAEGRSRIGMVGHIYRFAPAFEIGHSLLARGKNGVSPLLGRPVSAFFRIGGRGSHQAWKHNRAEGGGAINEMLVHMLDIAIWYFGPVQRARLLDKRLIRPRRAIEGRDCEVDAEDFVLACFEMEAGLDVLIQADLVTPSFAQYCEVQTEDGSFFGSIQPDMPSYVFSARPLEGEGYSAGKSPILNTQRDLYGAMLASFVTAVKSGRSPERCSISESPGLMWTLDQLRAQ